MRAVRRRLSIYAAATFPGGGSLRYAQQQQVVRCRRDLPLICHWTSPHVTGRRPQVQLSSHTHTHTHKSGQPQKRRHSDMPKKIRLKSLSPRKRITTLACLIGAINSFHPFEGEKDLKNAPFVRVRPSGHS